jgi:hypothetical protein
MSKYKIGDKVYVPYGSGDSGTIVDIKRFLFVPIYVVKSDSYVTMEVIYRYTGLSLALKRGNP